MSEQPKTDPEVRSVEVHYTSATGNDAMNMLMGIWLCGFRNGVAMGLAHPGPMPAPVANGYANSIADDLHGDRLRVEEIREDVARHIRNVEFTVVPGSPA